MLNVIADTYCVFSRVRYFFNSLRSYQEIVECLIAWYIGTCCEIVKYPIGTVDTCRIFNIYSRYMLNVILL